MTKTGRQARGKWGPASVVGLAFLAMGYWGTVATVTAWRMESAPPCEYERASPSFERAPDPCRHFGPRPARHPMYVPSYGGPQPIDIVLPADRYPQPLRLAHGRLFPADDQPTP